MSRTFRRKWGDQHDLQWALTDYIFIDGSMRRIKIDPKSKEGRKNVARYHSDAGTNRCKEPGPSWFRTEFTQSPYRARARSELRKALFDEDCEVVLESMPCLEYWT